MLNRSATTAVFFTSHVFNLYFYDVTISDVHSSDENNVGVISLNDFELIRVIGRGSYAKVLMVELKKTKRIYAMKVIKKELVTDDEVAFLSNLNWSN